MLNLKWICDQQHKHWYEHIYTHYEEYSPHNSKHLIDIYSLTHIFWSLFMVFLIKEPQYFRHYPIKYDYYFISLIIILFEIHENLPEQIKKYRRIEINSAGKTSYRGDTILNFIGDIAFGFLGLYIGYKLSKLYIFIILIILFITITNVVGINYWIDFIKFINN
jgi:hypothetical protein